MQPPDLVSALNAGQNINEYADCVSTLEDAVTNYERRLDEAHRALTRTAKCGNNLQQLYPTKPSITDRLQLLLKV